MRDTDLAITEIAFQTGWESLGTFGRTFRDIVGQSPGDYRASVKAGPAPAATPPPCFVSAARRPDLTIAVSEKRRRTGSDSQSAEPMAVRGRGP